MLCFNRSNSEQRKQYCEKSQQTSDIWLIKICADSCSAETKRNRIVAFSFTRFVSHARMKNELSSITGIGLLVFKECVIIGDLIFKTSSKNKF